MIIEDKGRSERHDSLMANAHENWTSVDDDEMKEIENIS